MAAALVLLVIGLMTLPWAEWLPVWLDWVHGAGAAGIVGFGVMYALMITFGLPASPLSLAAGFLWGPVGGAAIVVPSATVGATGAFLLGRWLLRDAVQQKVAEQPKFEAVNRAIDQGAFQTVALTRLSPLLPFNLLNYAFGLTRVSVPTYVVATFLGIAPGTLLFCYVGAGLTAITDPADTGAGGRALFWVGLVATFGVVTLVTRSAKRQLDALSEEQA